MDRYRGRALPRSQMMDRDDFFTGLLIRDNIAKMEKIRADLRFYTNCMVGFFIFIFLTLGVLICLV